MINVTVVTGLMIIGSFMTPITPIKVVVVEVEPSKPGTTFTESVGWYNPNVVEVEVEVVMNKPGSTFNVIVG